MPWLASSGAEHLTDLAGLAVMGLSSADKLRAATRSPDDTKASLVGGDVGRGAMDLGALAGMAAPSLAALAHLRRRPSEVSHVAGGGSKLTNAINAASLGALMLPSVDKIQAHLRGGDDKRLLGDKVHEGLEVAGLGGLAAGVGKGMLADRSTGNLLSGATLFGGYGTLAAPAVKGLLSHEHAPSEAPNPDAGHKAKPISELVGLSLLAAPSLAHMVHRLCSSSCRRSRSQPPSHSGPHRTRPGPDPWRRRRQAPPQLLGCPLRRRPQCGRRTWEWLPPVQAT